MPNQESQPGSLSVKLVKWVNADHKTTMILMANDIFNHFVSLA